MLATASEGMARQLGHRTQTSMSRGCPGSDRTHASCNADTPTWAKLSAPPKQCPPTLSDTKFLPKPCPSFPCFFWIPCFCSSARFFLVFWAFSPSFPRILGFGRENLSLFFWWFSLPFSRQKTKEGQGSDSLTVILCVILQRLADPPNFLRVPQEVRSLFGHFFWCFCHFLPSLVYQPPFAGFLLRQGEYHLPRKHYPINSENFKSGKGNQK